MTATLTITPGAGSAVEVLLSVLVINPPATLSSSTLTFPTTTAGSTSEMSVTVTNAGNPPLPLGTPTISNGSDFVLGSQRTTCRNAGPPSAADA